VTIAGALLSGLLMLAAQSTSAQTEMPQAAPRLLTRMYLMVHALNWLELTPADPRRQTATWEQWPGRCEICHAYEFTLRDRYYDLVGNLAEDCGLFVLPSGMQGDPPLIELAQQRLGGRCIVTPLSGSRESSRQELGEAFIAGLHEDLRRAKETRREGITEGEIGAWERSKAWATDLKRRFEANGYTFDPATVEFTAFGEDWCGCAATYPIHMGRALGLQKPVERRFDLINPDCSRLLLSSTAVAQNLPMPQDIRLFIFRSAEGRLLAQFFEGLHGLCDRPHVVRVRLPQGSARVVDVHGRPREGTSGGELSLSVGCGGHTPYRADILQADADLSLQDCQTALMAGEVTEKADARQ